MKKKLLVVVDMQNDFVDGVLGTSEASAIVGNVVEKIREYKENGDYVICTMDTHDKDYMETQEGKNLPVPHCIYPSSGWELNEKVKEALLEKAEEFEGLTLKKEYRKPVFGSWDLAQDLRDNADQISEIELVGVCTGICVLSNAVLIKVSLPEIPVSVDAACCACVTKESHETALNAMKTLQIEVHEGSITA